MRRFRVTVNGLSYEVTVEEVEGSAPVDAGPSPPKTDRAAETARYDQGPATAPPSPVRPPAPPQAHVGVGDGIVKAPLPGAILAVKVSPGDAVTAGQVVLLLEAMKMENEIVAPVTGHVRDVRVEAGDAVGLGDVLCVIEA